MRNHQAVMMVRHSSRRVVARRWILHGTLAGGLFWLGLIALARWRTRPMPWPIELFDTFALYMFAPFVLVGVLALLLRSRRLLLLFAMALILFAQQFGHLFLPSPALAAGEGPRLRVLTYNVLGTRTSAAPLAELIRAEQPEVVVLQELTHRYAADLERLIGDAYPYRSIEANSSNDGAGTFSRLPIRAARSFQVQDDGNVFQRVRLEVNGAQVLVYNVHLRSPRLSTRNPPGPIPPIVRGFGSPDREQELDWLIGETAALDEPYVLAGDFNIAAGSYPYRRFPDRWRDAFAERGWGFGHTFPTRYRLWRGRIMISAPVVRIDYVLASRDIEPIAASVPWIDASDHLPVLAELRLPAP